MKRIITIVALVVLGASVASAQKSGSAAMAFSAIPRNVEALSTGGTTALKSASSRLFDDTKMDIQASYLMWAPSSAVPSNGIGASLYGKAGKLGYSVEFSNDSAKPFQEYDELGTPSRKLTPSDMIVGGGISYQVLDFLSAGASVRYLSSDLSLAKYSAVSADILAGFNMAGITGVAGITSLGGKVADQSGAQFSLPTAITAAASYKMGDEVNQVKASAQADVYFYGGFHAGVGASYTYDNIVSANVGYSLSSDAVLPSYLSLGLSAYFVGARLSFAYLLANETIGNTLMFGVGYSF